MKKIYQKDFPGGKTAGFTLIELLVVVLIIGILAAIALPRYQTAVDKASYARIMSLTRSFKDAQERYYLANGDYALRFADLDVQPPGGVSYQPGDTLELIRAPDNSWACQMNKTQVYCVARAISAEYSLEYDHGTQDPAHPRRCIAALSSGKRAQNLCKSMGGMLYSSNADYMFYELP